MSLLPKYAPGANKGINENTVTSFCTLSEGGISIRNTCLRYYRENFGSTIIMSGVTESALKMQSNLDLLLVSPSVFIARTAASHNEDSILFSKQQRKSITYQRNQSQKMQLYPINPNILVRQKSHLMHRKVMLQSKLIQRIHTRYCCRQKQEVNCRPQAQVIPLMKRTQQKRKSKTMLPLRSSRFHLTLEQGTLLLLR